MEVTGERAVHGGVLIVSVLAPRERGVYVQMVVDSTYVAQMQVLGNTHIGLFMIGDISSLTIFVYQGASEIGHGSYDVNSNGSMSHNVSSGVCLGLFDN